MQPDLSHDHIHHSGSKNKLERDVLAFPSPVQGLFLQLGLFWPWLLLVVVFYKTNRNLFYISKFYIQNVVQIDQTWWQYQVTIWQASHVINTPHALLTLQGPLDLIGYVCSAPAG